MKGTKRGKWISQSSSALLPSVQETKMNSATNIRSNRAMTLVEVVILGALLVLVLGFLVHSMIQARERRNRAVCLSQLKTIAEAISSYSTTTQDYGATVIWLPSVHEVFPSISTPLRIHSTPDVDLKRLGVKSEEELVRVIIEKTAQSVSPLNTDGQQPPENWTRFWVWQDFGSTTGNPRFRWGANPKSYMVRMPPVTMHVVNDLGGSLSAAGQHGLIEARKFVPEATVQTSQTFKIWRLPPTSNEFFQTALVDKKFVTDARVFRCPSDGHLRSPKGKSVRDRGQNSYSVFMTAYGAFGGVYDSLAKGKSPHGKTGYNFQPRSGSGEWRTEPPPEIWRLDPLY